MEQRDWHKEKIVSVDFDGVLAQYDGWKGETVTGEPVRGGREFLLSLIKSGFKPVVFTTRKPELISKWLERFGFPELEVTNTKYPSIVYIDDRCVRFQGDFSKLASDLKDFKVHWSKRNNNIFADLK